MSSLPSFAQPPVRRVSTGFLVERASSSVGDLFDFCRSRLLDDYPTQHEHPAEELYRETPWGETPSIKIDLGSLMGVASQPNLQVHCLAADKSWGVKIQRDWVQVSWNRSTAEAEYPRWLAVRDRAETVITAFLEDFGGHTSQVEVQYFNTVETGAAARIVSAEFAGKALGEMESLRIHTHHLFEIGDTKARLHLDVSPSTGTNELELSLTVRGRLGEANPIEALEFADGARNRIVTGFADITSEEFHNEWRKQ